MEPTIKYLNIVFRVDNDEEPPLLMIGCYNPEIDLAVMSEEEFNHLVEMIKKLFKKAK